MNLDDLADIGDRHRGTMEGRHPDGRFKNGHEGRNSTHPATAKAGRHLRRMIRESANEADVETVMNTLLELAKDGDVQAAKLYLSYVVGPPPERIEITGATDQAKVEFIIIHKAQGYDSDSDFPGNRGVAREPEADLGLPSPL